MKIVCLSSDIKINFKHLNIFINIIKKAGLVISAKKMVLFQQKLNF